MSNTPVGPLNSILSQRAMRIRSPKANQKNFLIFIIRHQYLIINPKKSCLFGDLLRWRCADKKERMSVCILCVVSFDIWNAVNIFRVYILYNNTRSLGYQNIKSSPNGTNQTRTEDYSLINYRHSVSTIRSS